MLKSFLHRRIGALERAFDYDASYLHEIVDASTGAALKFGLFQAMATHRQGVPKEAWFAAGLAAAMAEDCGPCAQLGLDIALKSGVAPKILSALVRGDLDAAGADAALGFRYGRAVATNAPDALDLAAEAKTRYGARGAVSLAYAVAGVRVYPTLKRGLGHGAACQRLVVADETIEVRKAA